MKFREIRVKRRLVLRVSLGLVLGLGLGLKLGLGSRGTYVREAYFRGQKSYIRVRERANDWETIRIPPLMSKRTIRVPDEGEWRRRQGDAHRTYVCGAAVVYVG